MSWEVVKIGGFLRNRDLRFKPNDPKIKGLQRIEKIDFSGNIYISDKPSNTDMILIKKGDLVISGINVEKGAMAVYQGEDDITATIHYSSYEFDTAKIDLDFLRNFLKSKKFTEALKKQVPGGIKTEIKPKHILPLELEMPTEIREQKIIIKKFENEKDKVESIDFEQTHQLNLLKKLRQQILQDAVKGKLIPQDPNDEPASKLLERIKTEKERLIYEKKTKIDKLLPEIQPEEIPFEIPENWVWCRLESLLIQRPQNGYSPVESKIGTGIKCLTLTSTTSGYFKSEFFKYVDVNIQNDSYLWLRPKDILIQRGNSIDYVGIAAIYSGLLNDFIYPDLMIKVRVSDFVNYGYIHKTLISPYLRKYFQNNAFGAQKSMPKINQDVILKTPIPLPPIKEQNRLVSKIEQLMKICDELERSIQQNQKHTEELLQVALKEALEPKIN